LSDYVGEGWASDKGRKLVLLDVFDSPRDILGLLHELGHANKDELKHMKQLYELEDEAGELKFNREYDEDGTEVDPTEEILMHEEIAEEVSCIERRAWAWALTQIRNIEEETGIKLRELWHDFSDMKRYINNNLASYRRSYEWIIKKGYDESFYKE